MAANVADETFVGGEKFTEFASTAGEVSGFVKAVICRVIPNDFFGSGANKKVFMRNVDRFVKMRQYESPSLHESLQGLKVRTRFCTQLPKLASADSAHS